MKNIFFLLVFTFLAFGAQAQDAPLTGKKGQPILPESGDIGLGFNAIPFFNWFGNAFNNNSNNTYADDNRFLNMFGNSVIMGRYMLSENTAARLHFGFDYIGTVNRRYVQNDATNNPEDVVMDTRTYGDGNFNLGLGYEMRRGKGRIQGYYGADLVLGLNVSDATVYTYGNGFSATNNVPTSFDWGPNIGSGLAANERLLSEDSRTTFSAMVRPFIGVEYFVAPKMSIGAEFGWGISYATTFESAETIESFETSTNRVLIDVNKIPAANTFSFGTDNFNGAIFLFFYF